MGWNQIVGFEQSVDAAETVAAWDGTKIVKITLTAGDAVARAAAGNITNVPFTTIIDEGFTAGAGLEAGAGAGEFQVKVDDTTVEIATDTVQVKSGGISNTHINAAADIAVTKIADAGAGNNVLVDNAGTIAWESQATGFNVAFGTGSGQSAEGDAVSLADGSRAFTGTVGGVTPSGVNDLATKGYVDGVAEGLDAKESVDVNSDSTSTEGTGYSYAATGGTSSRGQITWTSGPTSIDGVALTNGDRILNSESGAAGGIYTRTDADTWDRATDFDADAEVTTGAFTFVSEGTVYADSGWVLTTNDPITIGGGSGTVLDWTQFSGAGQITAGTGLTKSGNIINIPETANSAVSVGADDIAVNVDDTTIEIAAGTPGTLQVKSQGITGGAAAPLATNTVMNTNINSAADIAFSKMEALTASRAVETDVSGDIVASAVTSAELNHLDGVTSGIQSQLDGKFAIPSLTADVAVVANGSGNGFVSVANVTATEVGHLDGVTSAIQTQLDAKVDDSEVGAANGVASLDANSVVVEDVGTVRSGVYASRPSGAIGDLYVASNGAAGGGGDPVLYAYLNP